MAYSRYMRLASLIGTRIGPLELRVTDMLLAVGLSAWALLEFAENPVGSPVPLLAMTVPLAWRRELPLIAFALVGAGLLGLIYEPDPGIRPFGPIALASLLLATFSVVTYAKRRVIAGAAVCAVAALAAERAHHPVLPLPAWLVPPLALGGVWLAARVLRDRSEREARLAEDARRLIHEQQLERELSLRAERERIARELHDVVSHGVTLMVLQSAAARRLAPSDPEGRDELLLGVERSGRRALGELRQMLAVLQEPDGAPLAPQPGLRQLPELIKRVRDGGLSVELDLQEGPEVLPPALELTAYRIVQEALTNSLKHGNRAGTQVGLRYDRELLQIEVRDAVGHEPKARSAEGRGLLGMRERVSLHRGTVEAGYDEHGAFAVKARLPLQDASS